jgi:16S rRNA G966 N2-methylase RsmD
VAETTWHNRITGYGTEAPDQLVANPRNWRVHPTNQQAALKGSLTELGWIQNVIVNQRTGFVLDGHARVALALRHNQPDIPVTYVDLSEADEALALATLDPISAMAGADKDQLEALLADITTQDEALLDLVAGLSKEHGTAYDLASEPPTETRSLADHFIVPPFSVLDARQGYWQERKRAWLSLGIQSEIGRGENALGFSEGVNERHDNGSGPYARQPNAAPGGSPRPAATLGADGKTTRGDGRGRGLARSFGQDLMRGEHVVGQQTPARLTWVAGERDPETLDDTSRKILAGGRRSAGLTWTGAAAEFDHYRVKEGTRDATAASGTSIFDPVLCELAYRWFMPAGGAVLDPFAGGSVRGIVASRLGHPYTGVDLSAGQVAANVEQAAAITPESPPIWHVGDSRDIRTIVDTSAPYDLIFSCPPYADLEVYSDDPRDLSTMDYGDFLSAYRDIIAGSVSLLADDRFACFVVGDVRDRKGFYRNFVSDTIAAFHDAGMRLYNEAILVTAVGSLSIRVGRQFQSGRKVGKTHQNVLVFYKGDPRAIKSWGDVEAGDPAEAFGEVAA